MKRFRAQALLLLLLCVSLGVSACGSAAASSSTVGGGAAAAPPTAPTATPKPKPSAVPKITVAFCQGIMTVAQANQIIAPPTPSTTVVADQGDNAGSCNYEPASRIVNLNISFQDWNGPVPVSQSTITAEIAKLASAQGVTISSYTNVNGVGDQAAFIAAKGVIHGYTVKIDIFYVLYGKIEFSCATVYFNRSSPPDASLKGKLQQCAEQVVSRL